MCPEGGEGHPRVQGDAEVEGAGETGYIAIGEVQSPHGVRGDFHVRILTDFPKRFKQLRRVYVGEDHRPYEVQRARVGAETALLKLAGIDSPEAARGLLHLLIYVPVAEAVPLGKDEYYWYQIIGLEVWTTDGRYLGKIRDILETGSNDVYVVEGPQGEVLVPAIEDVVSSVDLERGRMTVVLMEGML